MIPPDSVLLLIIAACLLVQTVLPLVKYRHRLFLRLRIKQVKRNVQRAYRKVLRKPQP